MNGTPNPPFGRTGVRNSGITLAFVAGILLACGPPPVRNWRRVEFHLAEYEAAPGLIPAKIAGQNTPVFLHERVELDDRDLDGATLAKGEYGLSLVRVQLTKAGKTKLHHLFETYQKRFIAIVIGGRVVAVPRISGALTDDFLEITGNLTEDEAARLTKSLGGR